MKPPRKAEATNKRTKVASNGVMATRKMAQQTLTTSTQYDENIFASRPADSAPTEPRIEETEIRMPMAVPSKPMDSNQTT